MQCIDVARKLCLEGPKKISKNGGAEIETTRGVEGGRVLEGGVILPSP